MCVQLPKWPSAPCALRSCQFPNLVGKTRLRPVSRTPARANVRQDHDLISRPTTYLVVSPLPLKKIKKHHRRLATSRRHCLFYKRTPLKPAGTDIAELSLLSPTLLRRFFCLRESDRIARRLAWNLCLDPLKSSLVLQYDPCATQLVISEVRTHYYLCDKTVAKVALSLLP